MRYEKLVDLLRLAIAMSGTAEGLSLDEIAEREGVNRRTAERMLASLRETFPQIDRGPGRRRPPPSARLRSPCPGSEAAYAAEVQAADQERLRLWYVAATRARDLLLLLRTMAMLGLAQNAESGRERELSAVARVCFGCSVEVVAGVRNHRQLTPIRVTC